MRLAHRFASAASALVFLALAPAAHSQVYELDAALGDHDAAIYCDAANPSRTFLDTGDVNGDGVVDLVIGRAAADEGQGQVAVLYGPIESWGRDLTVDAPDVLIKGTVLGGYIGSLLEVGDLDGDGVDDILAHQQPLPNQLLVFFGGNLPSVWDLGSRPADVEIRGDPALVGGRGVGNEVVVGHIDEDGRPDLLMGAVVTGPAGDWSYGILYGRDRWPPLIDLATTPWDTEFLHISAVGINFGGKAAEIADLDGDGHNDVLLGDASAASFAGRVWIWFGNGGRFPAVVDPDVDPPRLSIEGASVPSFLGDGVAVGDVDGDGRPDLALVALDEVEDSAVIHVLLGRETWPAAIDLASGAGIVIAPSTTPASLGYGMDIADFDGDGIADIACSDGVAVGPGGRRASGRALVFFGRTGLSGRFTEADYPRVLYLWGADPDDYLGYGRRSVFRDLDRDGRADVVVPVRDGDGPGNIYAPTGPGDILVLKGRELSCDLRRDDSIRSLGPPRPDLSSVLPLGEDDCYRLSFRPGSADPDGELLNDSSRPLVFYSTPRPTLALHAVKGSDGRVVIRY